MSQNLKNLVKQRPARTPSVLADARARVLLAESVSENHGGMEDSKG